MEHRQHHRPVASRREHSIHSRGPHKLDDLKPYIFKTTDLGKNWSAITTGIPAGAYVHAVREDPKRKGLLYAGTELGAFVSFDDGAHWQPLQLNLPVTPIHDLVVKDDDL